MDGAACAVAVLSATTPLADHSATAIHACPRTQGGAVRIVASPSECVANETAVEWNKQGPAGALFLPRTTLGASGYAASWSIAIDTPRPVQVN